MQISSRFTIAIHILVCIEVFKGVQKITSDFLAASVNANPVIIRRLIQQLKAAGLVTVVRGSGGADAARPLEEITLLDVYKAVDSVENGELFRFHENPNSQCPVGCCIHKGLDDKLGRIQKAMEDEMSKITLADVVKDVQQAIAQEQ